MSAAALEQLPSCEDAYEVAFAGRSNAGKSSAINTLTNQKSLARTSKTPGRTQLINLFSLDENRRLVDLPGYGFAKVHSSIREQWRGLLSNYIEQRECLKGVVVMMDCRHPMKDLDMQMIEWCVHLELPVHILMTKSDKLNNGPATAAMLKVRKRIAEYPDVTVQLFSALKKRGVDEIHAKLNEWYNIQAE
ncbi:ribosome biogenesis GTP-binding protein YihA/YsxC [Solemya velum gill symbiont]|uniref:ribosome biogenesis GTP-binding protein YihA/YsxC n=1 Tax=Solemya velum gill symbiont TaxID=2340 RepID=UPI0009D49B21|nr:ribosome biogenesis GTP-binding protein YihA/YsxC [Solemya velum gill symbiont]OOY98756.1 YihA family ribosome biogenesis GTP-binding protein [Solemya velum gill symbiont]OOZ01048.1 YihA family ribosome biogenesis GTP-binding protein [Solemya velum gill symbiont]OOZ05468.1 YihA family ribosome biogenesis GTP-binding protein [Solemya velum gill symbiont]OOZ07705.1 YihA family ribosome biogenesis GTP-binding protein [Solemya velum gill symbiont]OOZ09850.1 YihA family ribosome biogenesis GTP-b